MSANKKAGLVTLKSEDGKPTGEFLNPKTGEVTNEQGDRVRTLSVANEEDGDRILSEFATRIHYSKMVEQTRQPIEMRDSDGDVIRMDLGQGDVHIDAAMSNLVTGYSLAEGAADIALPVVITDKASNKFFQWSNVNAFRRVIPNGATPGGQVSEINPALANDSYTTVEYALGAFIPTEVMANADSPLRPQMAAVARVMNALRLEREIRAATLLRTSGNWDSSVVVTLAAAAKWNGGVSSDPVANLHSIIEASQMPVTDIVMSEQVRNKFATNAQVQKYFAMNPSGGGKGIPTAGQLSAILELPPITVVKMKYFASGTTMSYVWGGDVVLLHRPPQVPVMTQEDVATGYTFRWNGGGAQDGSATAGFLVRTYYDQKRGARGGMQVVVVHNDAEKMTANAVGGLIIGAYQ